MLVEQLQRAHQKAGRAVATLKSMAVAERLLHWMKLAIFRQAFNREYLAAIGLKGKNGARLHALAVEQHSASAAIAGVASDVRAGQAQLFAQKLYQQRARFHLARTRLPVYLHTDI